MRLDAKTVRQLLKNDPTLTKLGFSSRRLRSEDIQALATALNMNRTLTSLDFSYNKLGDEGAQALAKAIATNYTMTELILEKDIALNKADANQLQSRLETNKTIAREKNPIQKANLIRNATAIPYDVPTLMNIGIFAVGKEKSKKEIEALPTLPAELNEKIVAHFFPT